MISLIEGARSRIALRSYSSILTRKPYQVQITVTSLEEVSVAVGPCEGS